MIKNFIGAIMATASAVHILVKTEEEAEKLKEKLAKGADFALLAKKHSICPSGKRGGDLGEFRKGQMVKAFDQVVFTKSLYKVHGPVKTQFGFHLIKILYRNK
ncbi:peptidylprolyl isomerase PpiC [Nitrincola alkalisediminis]